MPNFDDTIGPAISVACLVGLSAFLLRYLIIRMRAKSWPTAAGVIESTRLYWERRGGTQSAHVVEVNYAYEAMGSVHHGRWKRSTIWHGKAQRWRDGCYPGHPLPVRYNPKKAGSSMILTADQESQR
jgi:hypothetical protein